MPAHVAEIVALPREQRSAELSALLATLVATHDAERRKLSHEFAAASLPLPTEAMPEMMDAITSGTMTMRRALRNMVPTKSYRP